MASGLFNNFIKGLPHRSLKLKWQLFHKGVPRTAVLSYTLKGPFSAWVPPPQSCSAAMGLGPDARMRLILSLPDFGSSTFLLCGFLKANVTPRTTCCLNKEKCIVLFFLNTNANVFQETCHRS